jgi:hypothetical protein
VDLLTNQQLLRDEAHAPSAGFPRNKLFQSLRARRDMEATCLIVFSVGFVRSTPTLKLSPCGLKLGQWRSIYRLRYKSDMPLMPCIKIHVLLKVP